MHSSQFILWMFFQPLGNETNFGLDLSRGFENKTEHYVHAQRKSLEGQNLLWIVFSCLLWIVQVLENLSTLVLCCNVRDDLEIPHHHLILPELNDFDSSLWRFWVAVEDFLQSGLALHHELLSLVQVILLSIDIEFCFYDLYLCSSRLAEYFSLCLIVLCRLLRKGFTLKKLYVHEEQVLMNQPQEEFHWFCLIIFSRIITFVDPLSHFSKQWAELAKVNLPKFPVTDINEDCFVLVRSFGIKDKSIPFEELMETVEVHEVLVDWLGSTPHSSTLYELWMVEEDHLKVVDYLITIGMFWSN